MTKDNSFTNNFKMLFLDLDGTVLNNRMEIPAENKLAIGRLINIGIKVVICSGRVFSGARYYAKELGTSAPLIACNGAVIKDISNNKLIYSNTLREEDSKRVFEICKDNNIYMHAYIGDTLVTEELKYSSLIYLERNKKLKVEDRIDIKVVEDLKSFIKQQNQPVSKFVMMSDNPAHLENVRRVISDIQTIELSSSTNDNFEVVNKGVNKGKALEFLCGNLGILVSETAAMGDNENDIQMLKSAGMAIAMGNAITEIKRIAHYVTDTNENYGVAKAIDWLINSRKYK